MTTESTMTRAENFIHQEIQININKAEATMNTTHVDTNNFTIPGIEGSNTRRNNHTTSMRITINIRINQCFLQEIGGVRNRKRTTTQRSENLEYGARVKRFSMIWSHFEGNLKLFLGLLSFNCTLEPVKRPATTTVVMPDLVTIYSGVKYET